MLNLKTLAVVAVFVSIIVLCSSGRAVCATASDSNMGVLLADDSGNILYSKNKYKPFTPASILKILTSLAAIEMLGPAYHFPTEYRFDDDSKNLYIKGKGDPLFISEEIERFCRQIILTTSTKKVHHIILDHSYFSESIHIPGKGKSLNPYDAPVGALCANFNTITFKWDAMTNRFISGEPQTPLLPVFLEDIKNTHLKQGRITLSQDQSRIYPGRLIKYFLKKNDIQMTGDVLEQTTKIMDAKNHVFFSSFTMTDVIQKLLKYSNNYIANQILLTLGVTNFGEPATLEKGVRALNTFASQHLGLKQTIITEGSGLSRVNRISPNQMLNVLMKFNPYHTLLHQKGNDFYKTGTLSGVRTRAGYIRGSNDRLYPYVIMINQKHTGYASIHKKLITMVSQASGKKIH